ncbi:MAG: hypothetical protein IJ459_00670 [Clostridia bacterium]|nr:hypothetical protein [Clostridia bacterium]
MNIKPGEGFDSSKLKAPGTDFAVTYMWFWNCPVTRELIDSELEKYAQAGVRSIYIVPMPKDFSPEGLRTYLSPEYLSPEFFELVEYTLRRCVKMGIKPWIYDEGGWPSGGACYNTVRENPKAKLKLLERREVTLMSDTRFVPKEGFIALYNGKHRLPDNYIASRDVTLTAYYCVEKIIRGCRVDYTNRSVTKTFINNTHEKYKRYVGDLFGKELPIIFTDEPGLLSASLADGEFELFEQEYGYDLRDYMPALDADCDYELSDSEKRARIDHYMLLGKLFKECTFVPLKSWCEENGVYYSGHLDIDNRPYGGMVKGVFSMVDALRNFHIPGVDVIWEQIRYPYGGRAPVDDETLGMGFFPRLASSAARQEGRNVTVTESLGIYGDGLTHDEIRYVINYQIIRGINAFNFAPISLGSARLSALMTRPNFRPEKPGFYNMRELNEYFERLAYLARLGHAEGEVALYMPCRDYCASPLDLDLASVSFKELGTSLEEKNIPFDIIDEFGVRDAEVTAQGLKLGDALYRYIALPECKHTPLDVKEKIAPFLGEGVPVYQFKSKQLRAMTRKLDTGRLWFIFNEGIETVCEELDISEGKRVYRIDARVGEMYPAESVRCEISCGDIAVYLVTDEEYEVAGEAVEYTVKATDFTPSSYRRFILDYEGIKNEVGEGCPDIDGDFSGEVTYEGSYSLPSTPKDTDRYRIRLEGFSSTVSVRLGDTVIPLGMTPMYGVTGGASLSKNGKITVTVANTAVNEIYAKMHVIEAMPVAERGTHYMPKLSKFETRCPPIRFGKVYIEKIV